jgi:DNA-directed RNA polymerase subunit RPC12/RpoP
MDNKFDFEMPEHYAVNLHGEVVIGCSECNFRTLVKHRCGEGCLPHPKVIMPMPLTLLPHWAHKKYTTE